MKQHPSSDKSSEKVGGSTDAARSVGGKLDFGIPAKDAHPATRRVKTNVDSPSERSGQDEGQRVVGVGAVGANPGHSGGAVDTDILGIGTPNGSSVSTEGTLNTPGGKDAAPSSTKHHPHPLTGKVGGDKQLHAGTTHNAGIPDEGVGELVDQAQRDVDDPNKNADRSSR